MIELLVRKGAGAIIPLDDVDMEEMARMQQGKAYKCKLTLTRNPGFHRKAFALLRYAFSIWEGGDGRNFEHFRRQILIAAGHSDIVLNLDGTSTLEAKSISWDAMDDTEFQQVYDSVLNAILRLVAVNYSASDLNEVVDRLVRYG